MKKYSVPSEKRGVFGSVRLRGMEAAAEKGGVEYCSEMIAYEGGLKVRPGRGVIRQLVKGQGIYADDTVAYVDNGRLYYGANAVDGVYLGSGEKQIHRLGSLMMVFPDEVYVDLDDTLSVGEMSVKRFCEEIRVCTVDKALNEMIGYGVCETLPSEAEDGEYCLVVDGSGVNKMYKREQGRWVFTPSYIKISAYGVGVGFRVNDTVSCAGLGEGVGDHFAVAIKEHSALYAVGGVPSSYEPRGAELKREVPTFDFSTISLGRLFGVRRGKDKNGNWVSSIYASVVNDPFNFSPYSGGVVYPIDVSGEFTALVAHESGAIAFTENDIVEIRVRNGSIVTTVYRGHGVEKGAHKSVVSYGGKVYYKCRSSICVFDGAVSEVITCCYPGRIFGDGNGCAAICVNGKYYINISYNGTERAILVYDTENDIATLQGSADVFAYAKRGDMLYGISEDKLVLMTYGDATEEQRRYLASDGYPLEEGKIKWSIVGKRLFDPAFGAIVPIRLAVRLRVGDGCEATVGVVDGNTEGTGFEKQVESGHDGVVSFPISGVRGDYLRFIAKGEGAVSIDGYRIDYSCGGEVPIC